MIDARAHVVAVLRALREVPALTPAAVGAAAGVSLARAAPSPYLETFDASPEEGAFASVKLHLPGPEATRGGARALLDVRAGVEVSRADVTAVLGEGERLAPVLDAAGGAETWLYPAGPFSLCVTYGARPHRVWSVCLASEE